MNDNVNLKTIDIYVGGFKNVDGDGKSIIRMECIENNKILKSELFNEVIYAGNSVSMILQGILFGLIKIKKLCNINIYTKTHTGLAKYDGQTIIEPSENDILRKDIMDILTNQELIHSYTLNVDGDIVNEKLDDVISDKQKRFIQKLSDELSYPITIPDKCSKFNASKIINKLLELKKEKDKDNQ